MSKISTNPSALGFSPYRIVNQDADKLEVHLKSSYAIFRFTVFRLLPIFIVLFLILGSMGIYQDINTIYGFTALSIFALTAGGILLRIKYTQALLFEKLKITRTEKRYFSTQKQVFELQENDHIQIKKERGFNNESWVFYLVQNSKQEPLFHIPILYKSKDGIRDNFKTAIEKYGGIPCTI